MLWAHRLEYHPTLGWRVVHKKKKVQRFDDQWFGDWLSADDRRNLPGLLLESGPGPGASEAPPPLPPSCLLPPALE